MSSGSVVVTHRYHDIEVESDDASGTHLVKILALDGRRFTYLVEGDLDDETAAFVKRMIDLAMISDLRITRVGGELRAEPAAAPLKKHG